MDAPGRAKLGPVDREGVVLGIKVSGDQAADAELRQVECGLVESKLLCSSDGA